MTKMEKVTIHTDYIRLDALLKYTALVSSGGEAKMAIADGLVSVNGEVCTKRGKKLTVGDKISFYGEELKITNDEDS